MPIPSTAKLFRFLRRTSYVVLFLTTVVPAVIWGAITLWGVTYGSWWLYEFNKARTLVNPQRFTKEKRTAVSKKLHEWLYDGQDYWTWVRKHRDKTNIFEDFYNINHKLKKPKHITHDWYIREKRRSSYRLLLKAASQYLGPDYEFFYVTRFRSHKGFGLLAFICGNRHKRYLIFEILEMPRGFHFDGIGDPSVILIKLYSGPGAPREIPIKYHAALTTIYVANDVGPISPIPRNPPYFLTKLGNKPRIAIFDLKRYEKTPRKDSEGPADQDPVAIFPLTEHFQRREQTCTIQRNTKP